MDDHLLERLLTITEEQAKATGALVEIQRAVVSRLDQIISLATDNRVKLEGLSQTVGDNERLRVETAKAAVESIKQHVARIGPSRLVGWVVAAAATIIAAALTAMAMLKAR